MGESEASDGTAADADEAGGTAAAAGRAPDLRAPVSPKRAQQPQGPPRPSVAEAKAAAPFGATAPAAGSPDAAALPLSPHETVWNSYAHLPMVSDAKNCIGWALHSLQKAQSEAREPELINGMTSLVKSLKRNWETVLQYEDYIYYIHSMSNDSRSHMPYGFIRCQISYDRGRLRLLSLVCSQILVRHMCMHFYIHSCVHALIAPSRTSAPRSSPPRTALVNHKTTYIRRPVLQSLMNHKTTHICHIPPPVNTYEHAWCQKYVG